MNINLRETAEKYFYEWEEKSYPYGSLLSDSHRTAFMLGFTHGYKFLNDNGEKADDSLLRTL